ncbi:unnamed protein product [Heligmosomoides polygyrus]|uniref:HTH La-type RNA-binding domain-containing protein n=1 Tax=Heligmosomoides polygyrus TaxID=6339 RepID=A0A183G061_HELPZ|nr:unnamed protein product [Heligmosomoides polygyrus]
MINVEPRAVRQEIDELLTSGRLERIETVSAHIFHMFGREWKEMTSYDILVHLFHDSLDDVDKLLARDRFKLIFNFVPLSASFTFTCLSRKFVRLSLNKFDRTAPAYGFGFTNLREMETFCAHLDRIRSYAKANLAPHLNATTLGLFVIVRETGSQPSLSKDQTCVEQLSSGRVVVMTYLAKMLQYLSENANDALVLSNVAGPEKSVGAAAENSLPPNMVNKILTSVSRTKSVQDSATGPREVIGNAMP